MGQVSIKLRRAEGGYLHWCPGCEETHLIPNSWSFNGSVEVPTFNPSVKITGNKRVMIDGRWTGNWVCDAEGSAVDNCCHYFLHTGQLQFCGDSTHALAGKIVVLPDLPKHLRDDE
jgi:hypothetical protein